MGTTASWANPPVLSKGLNRDDESAYAEFCGLFGGGAKAGTGPTSG